MNRLINKPHPFIFNRYSLVIPSFITFLIISVLAPFQFQEIELQKRMIIGFIISLIVALLIKFSIVLFKKSLPRAMSEDKWTVGKEIVLILATVFIIIIVLFIAILYFQDANKSLLSVFFQTASVTMGTSVFPIVISVLFEQYRYKNLQYKRAMALTKSLKNDTINLRSAMPETTTTTDRIIIKSENDELELQLNKQELVYIKSEGNYIEVYYLHSNQIQKKLIRNRLKNIEEILSQNTFFRCHKSYIINGNYIVKVEGNARNLELQLKYSQDTIPVSRSKAKTISTFIEQL